MVIGKKDIQKLIMINDYMVMLSQANTHVQEQHTHKAEKNYTHSTHTE